MAKEIDALQEKMNWHWRNNMRSARFFAFDARAAIPIPFLLFYARWSTLFITILFLIFFYYLERKGLSFPAAMRKLRLEIIGNYRPGWLSTQKRKFIDYG